MIYYPDAFLDNLLMEDIQYGDLTSRALNIQDKPGVMTFTRRETGCISGIELARRLLEKLGLNVTTHLQDGDFAEQGALLITAEGRADALHQGWKVVQNVLEWSCGVSDYMAKMLAIYHRYQPKGQIACTRKNIPNTKLLATQAVLAGGGIIHRQGCSETILLFANHRRFLVEPDNWALHVKQLRQAAPEKSIVVEADDIEQAREALKAQPDILQLDKFSIEDIALLQQEAPRTAPHCHLSLAGGINLHTIEKYAQTGITLMVTSAPYYAPPADIKVRLRPKD
ncbi:molybdenum transport system protein [Proteus hauseri ATCC 700826]|uniref:Putative pyrophosphorylase ModD n=1 Tax=Proteus hauseri ATCC 700826 TaxID=1354271 RepID=A0AAJ3HPS4_PROHU|nr:ModD protein [Proteus hauseri]OAT44951.1 molybdenum transport system protein [Proteus hauseri ATCC 700826]